MWFKKKELGTGEYTKGTINNKQLQAITLAYNCTHQFCKLLTECGLESRVVGQHGLRSVFSFLFLCSTTAARAKRSTKK